MAMGPFAAQDLGGIDIAVKGQQAFKDLAKPGDRVPLVMEKLYAIGRYGQKTGAGWYRYDEKRRALPDQEVHRLIEEAAREAGIAHREISANEIVERTIYALILEGTRILEEGYAHRASDVDVVYVNGYGFPAYRGGPMWYADTVGLKTVYEGICEFRKSQGEHWNPSALLAQLAAASDSFAAWDQRRSSLAAAAPASSDISARKA
jgi:3-hydroxyacyl-CoA dehydrogenase